MVKFRTTLEGGDGPLGIVVPPEVVDELGAGKRPAVVVKVKGLEYRNSIAVMGGRFLISFSTDKRKATNSHGGEEVDVELDLDTAPREVVVPEDLQNALEANPAAKAAFEKLSYSNKSRHVLSVEGTKNPETRQRRVEKAINELGGARA
jgi:hypothetical protein